MSKVNVLFLQKTKGIGGADTFLIDLIRNLDFDRFRPIVCLFGRTDEFILRLSETTGVTVYDSLIPWREPERQELGDGRLASRFLSRWLAPQGKETPFALGAIVRLARILRAERVHVLCYTDQHALLNLAPMAALLARTPGVIGFCHGSGLQLSFLERLLLPVTDRFTATSSSHGDDLVRSVGLPPEKIRVVNNGIDPLLFQDAPPRALSRQDIGVYSAGPVVGILARLVPDKCHTVFIHSAARVLRVHPDAHFLIVGDGPERPRLEQLTSGLGISSNVHFLGFRRDPRPLLSLCDVSVLSSAAENFPYSILESMAMEIPVVATVVGGVPDIVDHGTTGLLVQPQNQEALSEAILVLLGDREIAKKMGREGKRKVLNQFSTKQMIEKVEALIQEVIIAKGVAA